MVKYYYDKFTAIKNETYDYIESVSIPGTRIAIDNVDVVQMLGHLIPGNLGAGTVINPTTAYNGISIDSTGKFVMEKPIVNRDLKETVFKTLYEFTTNYGSYGNRYCYMQFTGPGAGTYKVNMFADYEEQNPGHFYTVTIYKLTPIVIKTTYSKGALVQTNIAAEEGTYPVDGRHTDGYWYVKGAKANTAPTVTLVSPSNNQTLYENDTINISGNAYDADKDQSVTAYYQIKSESKKVLATNLSQMQISLSKQLTFKGGKLYDGETILTGTLAEGVEHKLKVWAVDSEGAQSTTVERTFYVVPNRAPLLSVDAVTPTGVIDMDKFIISGTALDKDANSSVKVTRRINANNPIEIYSGTGGDWEFEVSLSQLVVGSNTIVVEAIDNYGAKTSKTIKLNKNAVNAPILQSVARYKVEPPKGSAKGVLLWVQRDTDLDLKVDLSMVLKGEQESYVPLTATHTVPVYEGVVEDEFYYETLEPKDDIILKLTTTRPNIDVNHKIHLIMGVLE
ncbi:Ig-like domain-containing protein [Lysinibacillus xylanilyticus]|uniref:Ig-like domain-containing protein n=1 Tax=Lysinibacillus xylanilyticus TaxID=582475 RepID=UPI0037F6172B